jgi:hypothetical protein
MFVDNEAHMVTLTIRSVFVLLFAKKTRQQQLWKKSIIFFHGVHVGVVCYGDVCVVVKKKHMRDVLGVRMACM